MNLSICYSHEQHTGEPQDQKCVNSNLPMITFQEVQEYAHRIKPVALLPFKCLTTGFRDTTHELLKRAGRERSEKCVKCQFGSYAHLQFSKTTLGWNKQRASIKCLSLVVLFAVCSLSEAPLTCAPHGAVGGCGLAGRT